MEACFAYVRDCGQAATRPVLYQLTQINIIILKSFKYLCRMQNNINRSLIAAQDLLPLQYKTFSYDL